MTRSDDVKKRFPEESDLVSITINQVEYFGYVDAVDYDLRHPRVRVEFFPGLAMWFDFSEIRMVDFPKERAA